MTTLPEGSAHVHRQQRLARDADRGLSDACRRCWLAADDIEVDTFDGALDSLLKCLETAY